MSALKDAFPGVHFRYDEDRYAVDLEQFAAWLFARRYPNKAARTHLYNVQQVLRAPSGVSGVALNSTKLSTAFRRLAVGKITYQHTPTRFTEYL